MVNPLGAFENLSFRHKLTAVISFTTCVSLILMGLCFIGYEWRTYSDEAVKEAVTLSDILGSNSTAALLFDDDVSGAEVLSALRSKPYVEEAALFTAEGALFAGYHRDGNAVEFDQPPALSEQFGNGHLVYSQPIHLNDEAVGSVAIRMDLSGMGIRIKNYTLIAGLLLGIGVLVAVLMSTVIQGIISRPVLGLAEAAKVISSSGNYSTRVSEGGRDELGQLTRAFNGMLSHIETRDNELNDNRAELHKHLKELEKEIKEREEAQKALSNSEAQLRQAQKMEAVGILAGGIAHDFNNILTAINGYGQLILGKLEESHQVRPKVEQIIKAGDRAANLTRQLLAFSRKQMLETKVFNLNEVVLDMERMLKRLIGEDIEFITILDEALWNIKADAGQVEQIVLNLAVNARDAMPSGGKLILETHNVMLDESYAGKAVLSSGPFVLFAMTDTGCGIEKETSSHIFDPFFTTKGRHKGTGLGLSTVYGIIKQSGGDVGVYSVPGKGTTFKVYLPKCEQEEVARNRETAMKPATGTETILLVEDEAPVREVTREILEHFGYQVIEAHSGEDALLTFEADSKIDLVVSDVIMPGMNGQELSEKLKEVRPDIRVLFMSGYTDNAIMQNGMLAEGLPFLHKPFTAQKLSGKVREVLDAVERAA